MAIKNAVSAENSLYQDVITGLSKQQKELPSKYFYDQEGSRLFEQICDVPEYYPTDCEIEIMDNYADEISEAIGSHAQLVELGSGSSRKTRILLDHLTEPAMYVPVDISAEFLNQTADILRIDYPHLNIKPVAADYTELFKIPFSDEASKRVVYFPGSTIGNFTKENAKNFLINLANGLETGDGLLIGVDLKKNRAVLDAAYNDSQGITAAFNKNLLTRINRELSSNFEPDAFKHHAFYNSEKGRVEMHLVSRKHQAVTIGDDEFTFSEGETIHTENSNKYTISEFRELASGSFSCQKTWTDSRDYFSVHYFNVSST
ncbi:L-histidine N(alpha)-methyltransferase [Rhodohalobacter sp. SW132]|uniref:L-histidine N(alpha)-methyltransferase n=1 Tax=Rhodohalobacter sp. SW132 TaxID=2293433 RepID=UPI000E27269C|nr:L-histidine N(alpha)-methyltransferase [Rhodohalobacter sp. SW132]REL38464.1 L-histidine N(alpha)-methyltransferase [Rhodohalobacter sp. SW132]